jgi:CHAT domain-containing protein
MTGKRMLILLSVFFCLVTIPDTIELSGKVAANRKFMIEAANPPAVHPLNIVSGSLLSQDTGSLSLVKGKLKKKEILIEYILTDTLLIIVSVSNTGRSFFRRPADHHFRETVRNYKRELKIADITNIVDAGKKMYALLISPIKNLLNGKERLIIIPGEDLSGIPFESFIVDEPKPINNEFSSQHFLIRDFEVTYHYSANQWARNIPDPGSYRVDVRNGPQIDFTGFSPGFHGRNQVNPLPGTKEELVTIISLFNQKGHSVSVAFGEQSKKDRFMELAGNSRIIHLATHNYLYSDNLTDGGIIFWDYEPSTRTNGISKGVLTLKDIYGLRLKADLIVLNICSSGFIQKNGRNGLCSLPLGFLYAGAKNILATLWNINDRYAALFVINFYRKWLSGKTYSQSLRETKLEMISCRETALPTLWATYILIGQ